MKCKKNIYNRIYSLVVELLEHQLHFHPSHLELLEDETERDAGPTVPRGRAQ